MQEYFEPEQAFSISMLQPFFEISIAYEKRTCIECLNSHEVLVTNLFYTNVTISLKLSFSESFFHVETSQFLLYFYVVTALKDFEELRSNP